MSELLASAKHYEAIKDGGFTLRQFKRAFDIGQTVKLINTDGTGFVMMRVQSVSVAKLRQFDLAALGTSIEEMKTIYPTAEADSTFTRIGLEPLDG